MIEIPLTRGQVAYIDDTDADLIGRRWHTDFRHENFYAIGSEKHADKRRLVKMHRVILARKIGRPLEKGEMCDHINGNGLDNRRENLRVASARENNCNARIRKDNTSGMKGIHWSKDRRRWCVQISKAGKIHYVGRFASLREAAIAYNEKALDLHGEFAWLNPIGDE